MLEGTSGGHLLWPPAQSGSSWNTLTTEVPDQLTVEAGDLQLPQVAIVYYDNM